jgi:hypothetical protein
MAERRYSHHVIGIVIGAVVGAVLLLSVLRLVWSMRNTELEAGGSYGTQFFGRIGKKKRETTDDF